MMVLSPWFRLLGNAWLMGKTGVEKQNCCLDNHNVVITLVLVARQCMVDGVTVAMPTRLPQSKTEEEKLNCCLDNHDGLIILVMVASLLMIDRATILRDFYFKNFLFLYFTDMFP